MNGVFVLKSLVRALVTLWLLMTFTFVALQLSTDPALQILGPEADEAALASFREAYGLNAPLWRQYLDHLTRLVTFDFGTSFRTGRPAVEMVAERINASIALMVPVGILAVLIGVPLGALAALHRDGLIDRAAMVAAVAGFAIPNFLVGILLIYVFSVWLGWIPPTGIVDWRSWVMPVLTMATAEAALFARFTRTALVEVIDRPMMETALAGGVPWPRAVREHALPNAAVPIITVIGLVFGALIAGAVVTENVFAWPGLGRLLVSSVQARDFAVVQVIVLLLGLTMIVANLLVDIAQRAIDPRVREARP